MNRIFDITLNDLRQLLRDRQTFLFLLLMPIAFTLLFGLAFGSFNKPEANADTRPIVVFNNQDDGNLGNQLADIFSGSNLIQIKTEQNQNQTELESLVKNDSVAAVVTVPTGYTASLKSDQPIVLELLIKQNNNHAYLIETEVKKLSNRMVQSTKISHTLVRLIPGLSFEENLNKINKAWRNPPIVISSQIVPNQQNNSNGMSAAQTAPGMMLQFSLAGLLTAGQMIVNERKSRVFQRLLTTATSQYHILFGHYFAILALVFVQFVILILFGQFIMGLDYLNQALPTFLLTLACAMCIAAIGLLIGMLAKSDDQAIIFALIPMFIFSGLGGAWMPLEFTGKTFQTIGHLSPVAWGMDGFKSILNANTGLETIWLPVIVLFGYGVLFFLAAAFTLKTKQN
ncbi:MAG: hypothetical protein CL609_09745 [Anaerolineaceae bacterium]|nr:hypothetical protein [Anaerolineaceae bacterium]